MARWIEEFQVTFPKFTEIMRRRNTITEQRKSGEKKDKETGDSKVLGE